MDLWITPTLIGRQVRLEPLRMDHGVLRAHMRHRDGSLRDTVVFSILAVEWPALRRALELKLQERAE